MKRMLVVVVGTLLLMGCSGSKSDKKGKGDKAPAAGPPMAMDPAPKDKRPVAKRPVAKRPTGPVYTATVMGRKRVKPIVEQELTKAKLPGLKINVPKGTEIDHRRVTGAVLSSASMNYSLTIRQEKFKPKMVKKAWSIVDDKGTVVKETKDVIIYKRSGEGGYLFEASVVVVGKPYSCSTVASIEPFTKNQVDQMIKSCRSLRPAK